MKIKYCTAQRVCETLRARVCVVCTKWKGDGDGAVRVLTRWGPLSCGLFECGGRWGLLDGGAPLVADSSYCCLSGSLLLSLPLRPCLDPFSRMLDSLRLRPNAGRAAMPILHCARDRVTCAARARRRGASVDGWRDVGRGCGITALERGRASGSGRMCVVVERERGKVGRFLGAVVLVAFRRDVRAVLISASGPLSASFSVGSACAAASAKCGAIGSSSSIAARAARSP